VSLQLLQQVGVLGQPHEGFAEARGEGEDPRGHGSSGLHELSQSLAVTETDRYLDHLTPLEGSKSSLLTASRESVPVPVLCENVDGRGVVGAVAHIQSLHVGHEVEEEASYPLLTFG